MKLKTIEPDSESMKENEIFIDIRSRVHAARVQMKLIRLSGTTSDLAGSDMGLII